MMQEPKTSKRDEMATKFSGRSRAVIDVLYHCGEENHWDLKETAFKAGWEAAVQNHKRVLQALQIAETKLEEIAKGRSWIGGRYSVSEMRTDEMQDIANDALAQIKDLK